MQLKAHMRLCQRCLWCYRSGLRLLSLSTVYRSGGNYYELLGVKPDASLEEIKQAFFNKSKTLHPDSDLSNPGLHSQFVALSEAYRVLSREGSRREYDLGLLRPFRSSGRQTYSTGSAERMRYWDQFRYAAPQEYSAEQQKRKKKLNMRLVGYCLAAMMASLVVHYLGFSSSHRECEAPLWTKNVRGNEPFSHDRDPVTWRERSSSQDFSSSRRLNGSLLLTNWISLTRRWFVSSCVFWNGFYPQRRLTLSMGGARSRKRRKHKKREEKHKRLE